jgi:16S rRNA processing protein RimM
VSSSTETASEWTAIAKLLRPQGRRGELLAEPLTDLPDFFAGLTANTRELTLASTDTPPPEASTVTLESHFFPTGKNAGRIVLKLSGCDSIAAAEALAGQQLLLPNSALPTLDADTFFVRDLLGCTLYDSGLAIGTIVDLEFATAPDGRTRLLDAAPLLAVQLLTTPDTDPVLVPFIRAWLSSVDLPARRIVMQLPEGLLSTE